MVRTELMGRLQRSDSGELLPTDFPSATIVSTSFDYIPRAATAQPPQALRLILRCFRSALVGVAFGRGEMVS